MNLVTVIPISKGVFKEELTYFTAKNIEVGMLVNVPIRSSNVPALVVFVEPLTHAKSSLKNSAFALKKIESVIGSAFFAPEVFEAARVAGRYFASETGRVLNLMLPAPLLKNYENLTEPKQKEKKKTGVLQEKLIFQASIEDRMAVYKTYIRAAFAQKQSVFFCVPTKESTERMLEILGRGIEEYIYTLHNGLLENEIISRTNKILKDEHSIVIIGTGGYLSVPRHDIETIIVEEESSSLYKTVVRPFVDFRIIAEIISAKLGIKLILGDTLARIATRGRLEAGECSEFIPLSFRMPKNPKITLVEKTAPAEKTKAWDVMEEETKNLIAETSAHGKNILILALKKGYAGSVVCRDCGHEMACRDCLSKLELRESSNGTRVFACHECGKKENAETTCPKCQSWNLAPIGIGADRVFESLSEAIPKNKIFQIDALNTSTPLRAQKIYEKYLETKGGILITTEAGYKRANAKSYMSVVLSTDALLGMPSFKASEKYAHLIRDLKDTVEENILIETKEPENPILSALCEGQLADWYRNENSLRERFGYPPFTVIVRMSWQNRTAPKNDFISALQSSFKDYNPALVGTSRRGALILKIKRESWAIPLLTGIGNFDKDLHGKLLSLSPNFIVEIDPE